MNKLDVHTVTVVGANGMMGRNVSAIFTFFGHAKVYMISRDINKSKTPRNAMMLNVGGSATTNYIFIVGR